MKGFLLYEGPSQIDGEPVACIVTNPAQSRLNEKTQRVIQTYILRSDIDPVEAIRSGQDVSICGDCTHRAANGERSCYVQVWSAPRNIWLAYQNRKYPLGLVEDLAETAGEVVRMGAYGDPAAIPFGLWSALFAFGAFPLGYTHQWRSCDPRFKLYCMASVESAAERVEARAMGWRTFRVRRSVDAILDHEVACPASAESGRRTSCSECRACGGHSAKAQCDIAIIAHGDRGKVSAFSRKAVDGLLVPA